MGKINILSERVYNRIAAGEVVERPASVVKEFTENALDAGASRVEITAERGGKDLIRVADDGEGIEESDLKAAFLPHATSKIRNAEDLERVETMGFRGEALASIASVSQVTLRSRQKDADGAFEIRAKGGTVGEIVPCALGGGTEITAEHLFYNTPAREKFLKSDKGEESEITQMVTRFILGRPDVAFSYVSDGKKVLQSFGGGADEAMGVIYGEKVLASCYKVDAFRNGVRIRGFLGQPGFAKANRTYQHVFVNGRHVVNMTISSAVTNAYTPYLMKRQYPFFVLYIEIPPEIVDVNVHPNKSDVRFSDNRVIYGSIYRVVSDILDGNADAVRFLADEGAAQESGKPEDPGNGSGTDSAAAADAFSAASAAYAAPRKKTFDSVWAATQDRTADPAPDPQGRTSGTAESRPRAEGYKPHYEDLFSDRKTPFAKKNAPGESADGTDVFEENRKYLAALESKKAQQKIFFEKAVYKGNLFHTYLIYEVGEKVYFIDQHAAHERLLYDDYRRKVDERSVIVQPMLVPYILKTTAAESEFLSANLDAVRDMGFEIEEFGTNIFQVSAVPADLENMDLAGFFEELLRDANAYKSVKMSDVLHDRLAMTACKHAVKGGDCLSETEERALFALLDGDIGLKCPHGRPIACVLTKYEIEKMFRRTV